MNLIKIDSTLVARHNQALLFLTYTVTLSLNIFDNNAWCICLAFHALEGGSRRMRILSNTLIWYASQGDCEILYFKTIRISLLIHLFAS